MSEQKYKMIPVEWEVYEKILDLCKAYEMPKRSQGALVGKLVNQEHTKLKALKLLPKANKGKVAELPEGE